MENALGCCCTTDMSESFFNAKLTLSMHLRKLALTVITKKKIAKEDLRRERPEFGFAAHCLGGKPRTFAWFD